MSRNPEQYRKNQNTRPARICNICGNPEAPRRIQEHDETVYCFGHVGIRYHLWNLSPQWDALGNKQPAFKDYQRFLQRKYKQCLQKEFSIDHLPDATPEPDAVQVEASNA
jgi:hypothetical protein